MTEFERKVLFEVSKVPLGEVCTYEDIAVHIGSPKAYRAVANALRKNPYPLLIPCHRVIGKNGQMRGYALGIKLKEDLIKFEKTMKDMLK